MRKNKDVCLQKQNTKKAESRVSNILFNILFTFMSFLTGGLFVGAIWYQNTFDISFRDLLFNILSPLKGTGSETVKQIFVGCIIPGIIFALIYWCVAWVVKKKCIRAKRILASVCVVSLIGSFLYAVYILEIPQYIKNTYTTSELYEREYVDPASVNISDKDGNSRNLIYIYLESMETTYASTEDGGAQNGVNYMPKLTELAKNNISFSDEEGLGGFRSISGTGWTMGALMGMTSGVPFSLAVFGDQSHNSQGKDGSFVNGLVTIGDILNKKGYVQEFLCGSDGSFAGRDTYFSVHGDYKIFDYHAAVQEGYIDEDYYVFWGLEDEKLFEIAKDEVTALAKGDKPFNFTMLTVDPHHVGGYKCRLCQNQYSSKTANVIACQDSQVSEFIEWCKAQDFYENTTIVVVGDHPRMDKNLIGNDLEIYDRPMYNCIINSAVEASAVNNRTFTSLDMFPTTLAAMGFEIEGDRLGLGTNMFSSIPTLCEKHGAGKMGYDWLDKEVSKSSEYYKENFVKKK